MADKRLGLCKTYRYRILITANINAQGVGRFSLQLQSEQFISQVNNWYAYDEDQVYLLDNGGQFIIYLDDSQADITHITDLPMRARLLTLSSSAHITNNKKHIIRKFKNDQEYYKFTTHDQFN